MGLALALILLVLGVSGVTAVVLNPDMVFASEVRRSGLFLAIPALALLAGVFSLVRGFLAISPWLRHRAATPLDLRRQQRAADLHTQPLWPLLVFGSLALVGFIVLAAIFSQYTDANINLVGRLVQLEILAGLALLAAGCLGLAAQKLYFARFHTPVAPAA